MTLSSVDFGPRWITVERRGHTSPRFRRSHFWCFEG